MTYRKKLQADPKRDAWKQECLHCQHEVVKVEAKELPSRCPQCNSRGARITAVVKVEALN